MFGRLIEFDDASRQFPVRSAVPSERPVTKYWDCSITLDQGQEGSCHKEGTEVLTQRGWVDFRYLSSTDELGTVNQTTHILEFQRPSQLHTYEYSGPLVCSSNRNVQFAVTPDHRMYVRRWVERDRTLSADYSFVPAGSLGWYVGLMNAPSPCPGTVVGPVKIAGRTIDGTDLIRFIAVFLADGCLYNSGRGGYRVEIGASKERKRLSHYNILSKLGLHICVYDDRFTVYSKDLFTYLGACYGGGALTKSIPDFIMNSDQAQLREFVDAFASGDGHTTEDGRVFLYTSSSVMADQLQIILLKMGVRSCKLERAPRDTEIWGREVKKENCSTCYIVSPWRKSTLSLERKNKIHQESYSGLVYCATVPNGTLITRYRGTVLISGNCVGHAWGHELIADPAELLWVDHKFCSEQIYWEAQKIDSYPGGAYPGAVPFMEGTSVLAGAKILMRLGLIDNYRWAFGLDDLILGVSKYGPAVIGVNWYEGMQRPDCWGKIKVSGRVTGGHAILVRGVNVEKELFTLRNSWGKNYGKNGDCHLSFSDMWRLLEEQGEACFALGRQNVGKPV